MTDANSPKIDFAKVRREALSAWWSADYSVEGLGKKKVPGVNGRTITLHDYWFGEGRPPRVVEFAGRQWTIFHLPITDLEGNKSEKASWSVELREAFYAEIFQREAEGQRNFQQAGGPDDLKPRAWFDGVVFPPRSQISAGAGIPPSYNGACFTGAVDLRGVGLSTQVNFRNSVFESDVSFAERSFLQGADFDRAAFLGYCRFSGAAFSGPSKFAQARFFGQVNFERSTFAGAPDFRDAIFYDRSHFDDGAANGIVLDSAEFFEKVSFRRRDFKGPASLRGTIFRSAADFGDCKFDDTLYTRALFTGPADFSSKNGGQFGAEVDFDETDFRSDIDFSGRVFLRSARFIACRFSRAPQFSGAVPHPSTSFRGSHFADTIGDLPEFKEMFGKAVALRSREGDIENIVNVEPPLGLPAGPLKWIFRWVPFAEWHPGFAHIRSMREASTKKLEDSYRTARHLFEADGELAGRFYALEMDTRRNRRDVSVVERWLLCLFALSSGYGRYIGRAIGVLLAAVGIVTVLMWLAFGLMVWPDIPPKIGDVFGFVWRLFLLPAPLSGPEEAKVYWAARFIRDWPVGYRLLSGVCALLTTGVAGVILVTFRRRFALK